MIKIDIKQFIRDRVWFGYGYRWVWVTDGSVDEMKWVKL